MRPESGGAITAVLIFIFFAVVGQSGGFLSVDATASWLSNAAELGVVAIPLSMLMIAGEFDLSIGSVVGLTSITVATVSGYFQSSAWIGVAISAVLAVIVGLVNGVIVVKTKLPSFIVTLAMMLMLAGLTLFAANALTGASTVTAGVTPSAQAVFAGSWNGFKTSIVWCVVLVLIATFVLRRTRFGNWIYATGGSEATARSQGVPTDRVKITLFVATSLGAVLVGTIQTLLFANGSVTLGSQFVFSGIAAAVIGGVLLTGGYGSAVGAVFGSLTYGIVSLGVFYLGWDTNLTQLFVGVLLLLAVLTNSRLRRLAIGKS
ncbi:ABC transporter permease [uncultured Amnibacterium sp.]|uniref:ABC transporter permease n=1 Tax=uncultured Amnibacterium sp. TaxID=1631851 RepID=UPI0035CA907C